MSQFDEPKPDAPPPQTTGPKHDPHREPAPSTFTPEVESLLRHLMLGAAISNAPTLALPALPISGEFPLIDGYEIERELGRGGMGVVYKARQVGLNRVVAIKMIQPSAHAAPAEVTRFLVEAEAIAAVKHENVVQVYELGVARLADIPTDGANPAANERPYFAMEFLNGGNLAQLLKAAGRLTPFVAAELIVAVAAGVQAAHDASIVHRDLKPGNILLGKDEGGRVKDETKIETGSASSFTLHPSSFQVKVSDFGLAKRLSSDLTRSLAVLGTPAYMAPEQAGKAKFVGPPADVYALGAILYECLTGRPPFVSDTPWSLIRQVMEDIPEPLRKRVPEVPRDLELICMKCLEKEPDRRYQTAAALADDLKRFRNGEPVSVRPIGVFTQVARWARRRPTAAVLVALIVVLAVVGPPVGVAIQSRLDRRDAIAAEARAQEAEAKQAHLAALQLADARELFALRNALNSRAATRPLGWTWANQCDVSKAVALAGNDVDALNDLRSAAAVALLGDDLRALVPVAKGFTGSAAATHPKTGVIALGEFKAWGTPRINLIDPATGNTVRKLTFTGDGLWRGTSRLVQDGVRSLAFSPDGLHLFVGTRGAKVLRFDLANAQNTPAATWKGAKNPIEQLACSPDGKTVYALSRPEKRVLAWDAVTGTRQPTREPLGEAPVESFAILPSGDLITCEGHRLCRWTADLKLVRPVVNDGARRLAVTRDRLLLIGAGPHLDVYTRDALTRTDRFTDPALRRSSHEGNIEVIAPHPSGAFVATAAGDNDRTVKVWGLASGRLIGSVTVAGTQPVALAWSGDGRFLFATASGHVARWELVPAEAQRFACFSCPALAAATHHCGNRIAALAEPVGPQREVLVGGAAGGPAKAEMFAEPGGTNRAGLTADPMTETIAVSGNAAGIAVGATGKPFSAPGFVRLNTRVVRFSPDGHTLWAVVGGREIQTFDPLTKKRRAQWSNAREDVFSGLADLDALAVGRALAVAGGRNGSVYLLNPATCEPTKVFPAPRDPVLAVAVAPDDTLVVAGTQNGNLRVIRVADAVELPAVAAHGGGVTAVAIDRSGTLLATGGRDRAVRVWRRVDDRFEPLLTVSDLPGLVRDLQFSPTDGRLIVLLANEHAVRVWDTDRLKAQLGELKLGW